MAMAYRLRYDMVTDLFLTLASVLVQNAEVGRLEPCKCKCILRLLFRILEICDRSIL